MAERERPVGELDLVIPGPDDLGPKMQALINDQHRKFVWAMLHQPNPTNAAKVAGYSDKSEGCKVRGCELMQRDDIQEALHEVGWKQLRGAALKSIFALEAIVDDPNHPKHLHAVLATLDRTGFAAQTEHKVTVEHTFGKARMEEIARRLGANLGIDANKLIGVNDTKVVEGQVIDG
jgi:phage terminase small subunit